MTSTSLEHEKKSLEYEYEHEYEHEHECGTELWGVIAPSPVGTRDEDTHPPRRCS